MTQDSVLLLLDQLCRIPSFHVKEKETGGILEGEDDVAALVTDILRRCSWLEVQALEVAPHIWNVLATDDPVDDTQLLIAGHLDTVGPSDGGKVPSGTFQDGKYFSRGALDTKGGIACVLDAVQRVGKTRGVSYLFYGDEETNFVGMDRFLESHQGLAPEYAVSTCGGAGKALLACRGCIEIEFTIRGKSGHAARPHEGVSAVEAAVFVIDGLKRFVETANRHMFTQAPSSINFAAIHGGSVDTNAKHANERRVPAIVETANATAAVAWFLIDVRPGSSEMTPDLLIAEARSLLCRFNAARPKTFHASFDSLESIDSIRLNFNRGPYASPPEKIRSLFDTFRRVHNGAIESPEKFGYIDIAELARTRNTALMCLSPEGGNIHAADEWVSTESVIAYRDCMVELLQRYKP